MSRCLAKTACKEERARQWRSIDVSRPPKILNSSAPENAGIFSHKHDRHLYGRYEDLKIVQYS